MRWLLRNHIFSLFKRLVPILFWHFLVWIMVGILFITFDFTLSISNCGITVSFLILQYHGISGAWVDFLSVFIDCTDLVLLFIAHFFLACFQCLLQKSVQLFIRHFFKNLVFSFRSIGSSSLTTKGFFFFYLRLFLAAFTKIKKVIFTFLLLLILKNFRWFDFLTDE